VLGLRYGAFTGFIANTRCTRGASALRVVAGTADLGDAIPRVPEASSLSPARDGDFRAVGSEGGRSTRVAHAAPFRVGLTRTGSQLPGLSWPDPARPHLPTSTQKLPSGRISRTLQRRRSPETIRRSLIWWSSSNRTRSTLRPPRLPPGAPSHVKRRPSLAPSP
jgi:hypothetical protein